MRRRTERLIVKVGTRSILFGYHQFLIHPLVLAVAWWRLYGFPTDIRLWVAFFIHDLGYWGKPNMDGDEGELHPYWAANKMHKWFDGERIVASECCPYGKADKLMREETGWRISRHEDRNRVLGWVFIEKVERETFWYDFTLCHSRFLAKKIGKEPSRLCLADKHAIVIFPTWIQLFLMHLSGEIHEYLEGKQGRTSGHGMPKTKWVEEMKTHCREFITKSAAAQKGQQS